MPAGVLIGVPAGALQCRRMVLLQPASLLVGPGCAGCQTVDLATFAASAHQPRLLWLHVLACGLSTSGKRFPSR